MADYRLTLTAENQLIEILSYTEEQFGERQADAYHAGMISAFELLAQFPGIGPQAYDINQGWHRYRYQSHFIFYADQGEHVLIEAIIHTKKDIRPDLFT